MARFNTRKFCSLLSALLLAASTPGYADLGHSGSTQQASIAIIIDDMGNNLWLGKRALQLPGPVTYSVLPHSTYGKQLARLGHNQNKEIMLHMPMGNDHEHPLGPGALTGHLSRPVFEQRLQAALDNIPYIQGINNHMGSRLTQNSERMNWLMAALNKRRASQPLYFVDSRTSAATVAEHAAHQAGIPNLRRDVFLDHEHSLAAIDQSFKRLLMLAKTRGYATAIGHPHAMTLGYLESVLPKLDSMGIRLVSASGLMLVKNTQQPLTPSTATLLASRHTNPPGTSTCIRQETAKSLRFVCRGVNRLQAATGKPAGWDYPG